MFHVRLCVERARVAEAFDLLGCHGTVIGPALFRGVRFWASAELDEIEIVRRRDTEPATMSSRRQRDDAQRPALALVGCLVAEPTASRSLQMASLLAGYTRRSILVDETDDLMRVAVNAALLDQGVVVEHADGRLDVLADPGPRVAAGTPDARELALLEAVYGVWYASTNGNASAGVESPQAALQADDPVRSIR